MHRPRTTQVFTNGRAGVGLGIADISARLGESILQQSYQHRQSTTTTTPAITSHSRHHRSNSQTIVQNQFPATSLHYRPINELTTKRISNEYSPDGGGDQLQREQNGSSMSLEQSICDDLQMFEQRLDEVLTQLRPRALHWQIILALSFMLTLIGAFHWLTDPETYEVSCLSSFWNHKFFTANCLILIGLFAIGGIHRRIFAPSIITGRVREVIAQFNMSCDERGKLILMPHPSYHHHVVVPQNQRNNNHNHRS